MLQSDGTWSDLGFALQQGLWPPEARLHQLQIGSAALLAMWEVTAKRSESTHIRGLSILMDNRKIGETGSVFNPQIYRH